MNLSKKAQRLTNSSALRSGFMCNKINGVAFYFIAAVRTCTSNNLATKLHGVPYANLLFHVKFYLLTYLLN